MFALAVVEETLELITALNGGVKPLVEVPHAYFVYTNDDVPTVILHADEFKMVNRDTEVPYPAQIQLWTL